MRVLAVALFGAALFACVPVPEAGAADWYTGVAAPAVTPDDWIVAVDASGSVTTQGSYFAKATVTGAVAGGLHESGPRVRIEGLAGEYDYRSSTGYAVTGRQQEGAALAGYEWVWRDAALAGYVGLNVRNTDLSRLDPQNTTVGTAVGAKAVLELYARPTDKTMIQAYGSYATTHNAYYARLRAGYALFGKVYVGPEVAVLGDDFFGQYRVGAHLTGLRLGPFEFGVSGGYLNDRIQKSGAYTSLDARAGF